MSLWLADIVLCMSHPRFYTLFYLLHLAMKRACKPSLSSDTVDSRQCPRLAIFAVDFALRLLVEACQLHPTNFRGGRRRSRCNAKWKPILHSRISLAIILPWRGFLLYHGLQKLRLKSINQLHHRCRAEYRQFRPMMIASVVAN